MAKGQRLKLSWQRVSEVSDIIMLTPMSLLAIVFTMQMEQIPEAWLSRRLALEELHPYAPAAKAPADRRKAWQDFVNECEPADELWAYHTCYDDHLAALTSNQVNGWAGFALVRQGEIVAHYAL